MGWLKMLAEPAVSAALGLMDKHRGPGGHAAVASRSCRKVAGQSDQHSLGHDMEHVSN